jgi:hypothetical protein
MLAGLERLLAWKLDLTHVDPLGRTVLRSAGGANTRYPAGRRVVVNTLLGHRSTSYTTCPGDPTIARLSAIRRAVSRIGRPKVYGGSATASLINPERGGYAGVHARFSSVVRWRVAVTGSNGGQVRSYTGMGSSARVRWNGRLANGQLAPQGWAAITVTASAGGRSARPVVSRVFVNRAVAPAGTGTGGFSAGAWRVSNANAEQLSTSARVFASYRWGRKGDIPVAGDWDGDGTQTVGVVRPSAARDSNHLLLRNSDNSVLDFWYGRHGDRLVVGDWDANGTWPPAAVRAGVWSIRNTNSSGPAEETVTFGGAGDNYLAGDWDGDGDFTPRGPAPGHLLAPQHRRRRPVGDPGPLRPPQRPRLRRRLERQRHLDPRGSSAPAPAGTSRTPSPGPPPRSPSRSRPRAARWSATGTTAPNCPGRPGCRPAGPAEGPRTGRSLAGGPTGRPSRRHRWWRCRRRGRWRRCRRRC